MREGSNFYMCVDSSQIFMSSRRHKDCGRTCEKISLFPGLFSEENLNRWQNEGFDDGKMFSESLGICLVRQKKFSNTGR